MTAMNAELLDARARRRLEKLRKFNGRVYARKGARGRYDLTFIAAAQPGTEQYARMESVLLRDGWKLVIGK